MKVPMMREASSHCAQTMPDIRQTKSIRNIKEAYTVEISQVYGCPFTPVKAKELEKLSLSAKKSQTLRIPDLLETQTQNMTQMLKLQIQES